MPTRCSRPQERRTTSLPSSRCSCRACAEESTYLKCPWRAKTLHCESADLVDILETGRTSPRCALSKTPPHVRDEGVCARDDGPRSQARSHSASATQCEHEACSNDYMKETRELIRDAGFVSTMDDHESFRFTPLVVEKVMGADAAQLNGVTQGFGGSAQLKYLMCFYRCC
ncbi:hypothetical protein GQ600_19000 [Phytophthora cactorum]|nr:hypothetical protein GQ600_19000 [Phytophthora cactorum]